MQKKSTKAAQLLGIGYRALKRGETKNAAKILVMAMAQEDAPIALEDLLPIIPEEAPIEEERPESSEEAPVEVPAESSEEAPVEPDSSLEEEACAQEEDLQKPEENKELSKESEKESHEIPELPIAQMARVKAVANKIAASGHRDIAKKIFAALDKISTK